jgi:hypothetical protein
VVDFGGLFGTCRGGGAGAATLGSVLVAPDREGLAVNDEMPRRARTVLEYRELWRRVGERAEVAETIRSHRPRATDVIISPFAKCGTTWLQQIFHTLRTGGDSDFDEISRVVPWIEMAHFVGVDLEATQRGEPRGFKSHLPYGLVPKPAKYIVAVRDPKDALVSTFRFMEGWFIEPGTVTIEEFAALWLTDEPSDRDYWSHLLSWWDRRDRDDVLLLSYESMVDDLEQTIRRVADFCGLSLRDDLLATTLERSSFAFMLGHKDMFDERLTREATERWRILPPGGESSKVRRGGVGGHRQELTPEVGAAMDAVWEQRIVPALGFSDYAALEAAIS